MGLEIPGRHAVGVHGDDLIFLARDALFALLYILRLKLRLAVTRDIQADLTELGFYSLGSVAVSGVIDDLGLLVVFFKS